MDKLFFTKRLTRIKQRCVNKNNWEYHHYGGKGIQCLLSSDEIERLWVRDNADNMKKPSIDRIDSSGHYSFENCRYVELKDNIKKRQMNYKYMVHKNSNKVRMTIVINQQLLEEFKSLCNGVYPSKVITQFISEFVLNNK